jgi:hypothetical protein
MELSVLNWNVNAIRFYERYEGTPLSDWTHYRFGVEEITRIASHGDQPDAT